MAGTSGVYGAGVTDHRRKWDTTEYEIKAQERLAQEREEREEQEAKERGEKPSKPKEKVKRELLKPREYKVGCPFSFILLSLLHLLLFLGRFGSKDWQICRHQ